MFGLIVWVVHFEESLACPLFVGFHVLAVVAAQFLVGFDVAGDTQQFDVVHVVGQLLHLLDAFSLFNRAEVMAVATLGNVAVAPAFLA